MVIQIHNSYLVSVDYYYNLNSTFSVSAYKKGWTSIDFDSTAENVMISGIVDTTSQIYPAVLSINSNLTTINWMRYFDQTSISTLNLTFKDVKALYDTNSNSILALVHSINNSSSYYDNINIFKLSMTDGSLLWSTQFRDYTGSSFGDIRFTLNPYYNELVLFYSNDKYVYYHAQTIDIDDGSMLSNVQIAIFKHYMISDVIVYPEQTAQYEISDVLMTAIDGYIMKINTRKANLDIIDTVSWDRPLYSINYDNFTLPLTTPSDVEAVDYFPDDSFLEEFVDYEVTSMSYTYFYETVPSISDATEMRIYFSDTTDIVT